MKKDFSGQLRTRNAKRLCTDLAAAVLFALKLSVNIVPSSVHAIYQTAGKEQLLAERQKIGSIALGQAVITPAFDLPAKYIVHTVGPIWTDGKQGEFDLLRSCYSNALALAEKVSAKSIAFPLISTGVYGFPRSEALEIALSEIGKFLLTHDMDVILIVFDKESFRIASCCTIAFLTRLSTSSMSIISADVKSVLSV